VTLPDATLLTREARQRAADKIRVLPDIDWPDLRYFNSASCEKHAALNPLCRRCGIRLRKHQRIGAAWMYFGLPGMLGDTMGLGKTAEILAVLAMMKEAGELGYHNRAVVVCKAAAVYDPWANEITRLLPEIQFIVADGDRDKRLAAYMSNWEVAVVSERTFAGAHGKKQSRDGDVAVLEALPVGMLVCDDIDPMRNRATETAQAVNRLAAQCDRVEMVHATPLQKGNLKELWSFLEPAGAEERLGALDNFLSKYDVPVARVINVRDSRDKTGRRVARKTVWDKTGILSDPKLLADLRERVRTLVLRRTAGDVDDVDLPELSYDPVVLDLNPRQLAAYSQLRQGILAKLGDKDAKISQGQGLAARTRAQQVCSGLAALDDLDDSAKLDWVLREVTGDLADEKIVVFVHFRQNVAALSRRLSAEGVGHVLMWGAESNKRERARRLTAFREDPGRRVLVGSQTIEASLNLQVARHLIAVDTIFNPARMRQLGGRVCRQGSPYPTVYFHHLLARDTLEMAYLRALRQEESVSDAVWDEAGMFTSLSPRQVLQLVATGQIAA
jgi:SNF2 family DNA or RNA helicase